MGILDKILNQVLAVAAEVTEAELRRIAKHLNRDTTPANPPEQEGKVVDAQFEIIEGDGK